MEGVSPVIERLNEASLRALKVARDEATRRNSSFVGTEHLLFGLISEDEGQATRLLAGLGTDLADIRTKLEQVLEPVSLSATQNAPFTPHVVQALKTAFQEASRSQPVSVTPSYLLVGLMGDPKSRGGQVLCASGLTADVVRHGIGAGEREASEHPQQPHTNPPS